MKPQRIPTLAERARIRAERERQEEADLFSVPRIWPGERAFVIGGGTSIDVKLLPRLRGRIFAVNSAFEDRPDADVLFWSDNRWVRWNAEKIPKHKGEFKIARRKPDIRVPFAYHRIGRSKPEGERRLRGLSRDPKRVGGFCSGGSAINLAFLFGCDPIVLLGFDMRGVNGRFDYHTRHRISARDHHYPNDFMPHIEAMAPELRKERVQVFNCSPISRLECFPKRRIDDFLS